MQKIFVLALFFSPAAMASYGDTAEMPLAILGVVVLLLLIEAKVR